MGRWPGLTTKLARSAYIDLHRIEPCFKGSDFGVGGGKLEPQSFLGLAPRVRSNFSACRAFRTPDIVIVPGFGVDEDRSE